MDFLRNLFSPYRTYGVLVPSVGAFSKMMIDKIPYCHVSMASSNLSLTSISYRAFHIIISAWWGFDANRVPLPQRWTDERGNSIPINAAILMQRPRTRVELVGLALITMTSHEVVLHLVPWHHSRSNWVSESLQGKNGII